MSDFGTAEFGTTSFGGDPSTFLLLETDAEITSRARALLARARTDGTGFKVIEFSIGQGGLDPFDYEIATPVNPDAVQLEIPLTIPNVALPGTLATTATDPTILTSNDLTSYLQPGYLVEVVTGSGTETLTVASVTATQFVATSPATWTDLLATGSIEPAVTGAKNIAEYERPNENAGCVYCLLDNSEGNERLSEVGIWAEIKCSPSPSEVGTLFLAAIAHFPLICKNSSMRYAFRVNVQF